ncbi:MULTISPECIES: SulP family inorganic anion transporter [unclassified Nitrospina]|uniref:SulP family inorganic anion transporter n=1 Tax=unclassified Nitrospina TaxID=2638683 RepID=UPI003F9D18BA
MTEPKPETGLGVFENIKHDLPASVVVFFVSFPLCLGIALASGASLYSGIIAAIVGGMVVPLFSGSALGVSGPAAGLTVIVFTSIERVGFPAFQVAVVLAGLFQVVLYLARTGFIAYFFPSSVIKGMLSGIGILILVKQIPHAVGYEVDKAIGIFQDKGYVTYAAFRSLFNHLSAGVIIIWAVSMALLLLWERPFFKSRPVFHWVQGPLAVVILGAVVARCYEMFFPSLVLPAKYFVNIPVHTELAQFFGQFSFPDWSHLHNPDVYQIALTLGLVASIETLLCLDATDKLDPFKRISPANQELKAQGIGNMCSGLIGGLPITQVIVRSSANIQSGGRTRLSAFLHGVFILLAAMTLPAYLNMIPFASLSAILMVVGYKLAKPILFKEIINLGWYQSIPFFVTLLTILMSNLLNGIILGLTVSMLFVLWENYKFSHYYRQEKEDGRIVFKLSANVSFLNKANILEALNALPKGSRVLIDASETEYIDYDVMEIIENFKANSQGNGVEVETLGLTRDKTY